MKTNYFSQPIIKGSLIVSVGAALAGLGNYFFNVLMSRMLGPAEYGVLAALFSFLAVMAIFANAINLTVSRYTAALAAKDQYPAIKTLIFKFLKKLSQVGLILVLVYSALIPLIANFLHLTSILPLIILGACLFLSSLTPAAIGGLRGLKKFADLAVNSVLAVALKLGFGILAVLLGWSVAGIVGSVAAAGLIVFFVAFLQLKLPQKSAPLKIKTSQIISYSKNAFWAASCLAILFNIDVFLARHFLPSQEAGYYAAIALLGKVIFFATGSVGTVLFPISAGDYFAGKQDNRTLKLSLTIILIISFLFALTYFLFPQVVVGLLFGKMYLEIAPYLGVVALIFLVYSLVNVIVLHYLSQDRPGFVWILFLGALAEIVLISIFHQSIWQIIYVMGAVMAMVLVGLIINSKFKSI